MSSSEGVSSSWRRRRRWKPRRTRSRARAGDGRSSSSEAPEPTTSEALEARSPPASASPHRGEKLFEVAIVVEVAGEELDVREQHVNLVVTVVARREGFYAVVDVGAVRRWSGGPAIGLDHFERVNVGGVDGRVFGRDLGGGGLSSFFDLCKSEGVKEIRRCEPRWEEGDEPLKFRISVAEEKRQPPFPFEICLDTNPPVSSNCGQPSPLLPIGLQ